jgi:hypothetical protein
MQLNFRTMIATVSFKKIAPMLAGILCGTLYGLASSPLLVSTMA